MKDVPKMCTACGDITYKIFSVEIDTKDPVSTNMKLYEEIANRLFQNKVISNINIGNNRAYIIEERQVFGFDMHLGNKNNPQTVSLVNVEKALNGVLESFKDYKEMKISLSSSC
ncbi:hypothetical protein [Dendrosporobacter sp. 1207_IL3150]|uniref:hypothetical protein n=1 Tax=Dendrosporobacter sp. 1207_IL3150 TaxID=3084054 RepID=UPI002FDA0835